MKTIARRLSLVHLRLLGLAAALVIAAPLQARAAQVIDGLKIPRTGHTATRLRDGNILVVGGENSSGPVRDSEIFDPISRTFSLGAGLLTARTEHTATRLPDGRVFIVGGRTSRELLHSTDIYNPETRSFSPGPVLDRARAGHTATLLPDGRIVVVGGDGDGSVEVFDPQIGAFSRIEARLAVPRRYHSAALLKDANLLIAGGNASDGSMLSSAELLDTRTLSFSPYSPSMRVPRSGLALRVLPDGKVQAIGGDTEGTMEMFNPVGRYFTAYAHLLGAPGSLSLSLRTQTRRAVIGRAVSAKLLPILGDDVVSLNNDFLDRTDYSLTEIPELGQALGAGGTRISGGLHTSAALYTSSTATVTTDKTDYSPGETIIITGTGWQPGETVSLNIHRDTNDPPDTLLTAVVDASGNIQNSDYVVQQYDLGLSFLLTATGQLSGYSAQTSFTDSGSLDYSPKTQGLSATAGGPAVSFSQTVTAPKNNGNFTAILQVAGTGTPIQASWVSTSSPTTLSFSTGTSPSGSDDPESWTVSFTVPPGTASGIYTAQIKANPSISGVGVGSGTAVTLDVTGCAAPTITTCAPAQTASAGASCNATVPDFTATTVVSSPGCTPTVTQSPAADTPVGLGATTVTINATNASGTATCTTTFTVNDTTAPTITLTGSSPTAVECHTSFTDPGATAHDNCAGDFAATPSGTVNVNTPGTYTITYNASDPSGNAATPATRTVNVVDTTKPTIALNGSSPMTVECHTTFTDPGATAMDACAGILAATPSGTVDPNTPGTYTITYNANDPSGNAATPVTRTVNVVDTTKPVITINGDNPATVECHTSYTDAGATANDSCAGPLSVTPSGTVNVNTPGSYSITYAANDGNGNTQTATRTVNVVDTTKPIITIDGDNPATVECHASYTDAGATANDSCAGPLSVTPSGTVNVNTPGSYSITYATSDGNGNTQTATRTVSVVDTTKPTIALNGSSPMTIECHTTFTDPGATATDTCAGTFAATPSGAVNVNTPGTYTITYNASDPSGNAAAPATRTVYVKDTLAPTITLNGSNPMTVYCHTSFTDPGATATDACAGAFAATPSGTVDPNTVGTYTITYNAVDPSGNAAIPVTLTVNVINTVPLVDSVTGPASPLTVGSSATVTAYFTDPDPGQAHTCTITWDDPSNPTSFVTVLAGATSCTASHPYASAGVYTVSVDVSDYCDHATGVFEFVVIYDPSAGFVTGGGWIMSPLGAYAANPTLTGKANFGFVSKYKKGSNVPEGETEFQFKAGDINFHSSAYDLGSLVISGGRKATYRGDGTVNGQSGYRFLLIAYDGNQPGGDGVDKFRIKITLGSSVVYDNRMGVSEDVDLADPTALGGGSIVIHK